MALSSKTVFTEEEWSSFNVQQTVTRSTYVQSGSKYYKPNEFYLGPRHEFVSGINKISPPKSFNSFVIEDDAAPLWPEILPFQMSNTNSKTLNFVWRLVFYIMLFLVPVAGAKTGFQSPAVVFLVTFLVSILFGILNKNGINRGMGLGAEGLTGSEASMMDPNVFSNLLTVAAFFALSVSRSVLATGREKGGMIVVSVLLFVVLFLCSASTLPILMSCGVIGVCLVPSLEGRNKVLAMLLPLLVGVAVFTAWLLGKGRMPCEAYGIGLKSANGDLEYGSCYVKTGNTWEDIWNENSHFWVSLGYKFEDMFIDTGKSFKKLKTKIANEFERVVAKLDDDTVGSLCRSNDHNNPLCVKSKRNNCEFSYCISPPDPIRMSGFDNEYTESQIEQMQKSRCSSHRLFHKSALKAMSENRASAKQKYCVNFHKNDDCSNVCKDYWKSDSDPVSRASLAKLESRLQVIDDSILEISPEEWVQMKRENLKI